MITLPTTLRIFPLGELVFFPDTLLPLHVFEPRYRAMVGDAMDDDRLIGMVLIRGADGPVPPAPVGRPDLPDVYPVGCAGRIVEHEALEDGRSLIVLKGVTKFRIRGELTTPHPYRVANVQALYEAPMPAEKMRSFRDELRALLSDYVAAMSGDRAEVDKVFAKLDLEGLVNTLAASLPISVVEKQSLLECPTAETRFSRLCEILQFRLAEAKLGLDSSRRADN